MTNIEKAAEHVEKAEKLLAEGEKTWKGPVGAQKAASATAHASLALFYQREAEREGK
jgi:hypothetical protein